MVMEDDFEHQQGKYLDTQYPVIITPKLFQLKDDFMSGVFRKEIQRHQPELWDFGWKEGITIPSSACRQKSEFKDSANWWLNKKYDIGTGRLVVSIEESYAINFVELGGGYRLHQAGFNPETKSRSFDHVLLLDWLYLKKGWKGKVLHDGSRRLRKFLDYLSEMPSCPYHTAVFHPAGSEELDDYSPHLRKTEYQRTGHTTADLIRLYRYWLKAKPTEQPADNKGILDPYWRCECFQPNDPIVDKDSCPFPRIMKIGEEPTYPRQYTYFE